MTNPTIFSSITFSPPTVYDSLLILKIIFSASKYETIINITYSIYTKNTLIIN